MVYSNIVPYYRVQWKTRLGGPDVTFYYEVNASGVNRDAAKILAGELKAAGATDVVTMLINFEA